MIILGIFQIVLGVVGLLLGAMMFGDIGIACFVGALSALWSGIAILIANRRIKKIKKQIDIK